MASGTVSCDWLELQDSHASGGATFVATNSVDDGNNTGWTISLVPMVGAGELAASAAILAGLMTVNPSVTFAGTLQAGGARCFRAR